VFRQGYRRLIELDLNIVAELFDQLGLSVARGERLVVLGPSGMGKSTLLKLLVGTLQPDKGSIRIDGHDITKLDRRKLNALRARIGMLYQYSALISSLSVHDNLALPLQELTRKGEDEIERIIDQKLAFVGLPDAKAMKPSELSGGMRKRVAVARALVLEPELLLFDEPTAGLDPIASAVIDELIIDLKEKTGATCIVVSHELDSAFRVATRMAMLHEGKIIEEGTPDAFRHSNNPVVMRFIAGDAHGPLPLDGWAPNRASPLPEPPPHPPACA
jgi:phospholipid/cholesterol/gamma-HCH transport system ATP-binding protein